MKGRKRPDWPWEKEACDRCGFTYRTDELTKQRGLRVCEMCRDEISHDEHEEGEG